MGTTSTTKGKECLWNVRERSWRRRPSERRRSKQVGLTRRGLVVTTTKRVDSSEVESWQESSQHAKWVTDGDKQHAEGRRYSLVECSQAFQKKRWFVRAEKIRKAAVDLQYGFNQTTAHVSILDKRRQDFLFVSSIINKLNLVVRSTHRWLCYVELGAYGTHKFVMEEN